MNRPPTPPLSDEELRHAVQALPPPLSQPELAAFEQRVLADWHRIDDADRRWPPRARAVRSQAGSASGVPLRLRRWLGRAGIAAGLAIAVILLLQPDAADDELAQPDVLSQMGIGEM